MILDHSHITMARFGSSLNEPASWFQFPAALKDSGEIIAWVCDGRLAKVMVNVCNAPIPDARLGSVLLRHLCRHSAGPVSERTWLDIERASAVFLPGHHALLKWDGEVVACVRDHPQAQQLADTLNAALAAHRGRPAL